MNKIKIIIFIVIIALIPLLAEGVVLLENRSKIQNNSSTPLTTPKTPTPVTSNISQYQNVTGQIVDVDAKSDSIYLYSHLKSVQYGLEPTVDIKKLKVGQIVTLVLTPEKNGSDERVAFDVIIRREALLNATPSATQK